MSERVCVVTGANKGLGLALAGELCARLPRAHVYVTARSEARGRGAVRALAARGLRARFHQLDVTDRASVTRLRDHLRAEHGHLDLLVNNAAVLDVDHLYSSYEECKITIDTNYRGVLTVQRLLFPLLRPGARVLNISSDCGHLSNVRSAHWIERLSREDLEVEDINAFVEWFLQSVRSGTFQYSELADGGTLAAYRVSKVALSALTRVQARALSARGVVALSAHPGLVRTDMTRGAGFLSAEQAARAPAELLLGAAPRPGGYYWFDGEERDWADAAADYYFKSATLRPTGPPL